MINKLLKSKSMLAIKCSFNSLQSREGRLRNSTHRGRALTLWWQRLVMWLIVFKHKTTPAEEKWYTSTIWNKMFYLSQWISIADLLRLLALSFTLKYRDSRFHHMFLMKLTSSTRTRQQLMWMNECLDWDQQPHAAVNDRPVHADRLIQELRPSSGWETFYHDQ